MATKELGVLRDPSNAAILNAIRNDASPDYQRRIPAATKASVSDTVAALNKFRPSFNEFMDALVNRIGTVYARNITWSNPLAEFKRGMLTYGDTIEEVQTGLLEAHTYDPRRDYMEKAIFGTEVPDTRSIFHKVNRQEFYKITVNEPLLQRAFLEGEGLSNFVSQLLQAPTTSDQWDEFLLTTSLFAQYERNNGFYHVHTPSLISGSTEDDARDTLKRMRAMADTLKFPSTRYNAAHMPTFAKADDLIIFATPEFIASIDVDGLAGAFNIDRADMYGRIVPIPREQFGVDGCNAIMTIRDFLVIADQRLENTSQYNPVSLSNNYFLHHWEVISASLFVPAVMFWTGKDDEVINITVGPITIGTLTVTDTDGKAVTKAVPGTNVQVTAPLSGTNVEKVQPSTAWSVTGGKSQRTTISETGVLTIGDDETGTPLTVTATVSYVPPADPHAAPVTKTASVSVDVAQAGAWWPGEAPAVSPTP